MEQPSRIHVDELQPLNETPHVSVEDLAKLRPDLELMLEQTEQEIQEQIDSINTSSVKTFLTVAAMQAASLPLGSVAKTLGYYGEGDGGGALYRVVEDGTVDGGSIILLNSGLRAKASFPSVVSIKQFGATGDGVTNDSVAVSNTIAYAHANKITSILVPKAPVAYMVANINLVPYPGLTFIGGSYPPYSAFTPQEVHGESVFQMHSSGSYFFLMNEVARTTFRGMLFYGKSKVNTGWLGNGNKVIRIHAETCGWYNLGDAVGTNGYVGESKFTGCTYCDNEYGIKNVVDCQFIGGYVVSNNWGLNLPSGANDNTFSSMKIEFNRRNIECFQSVHNSVDNTVIDRAGFKNIRAVDSELTFTNGTIRRAGYEETSGTRAHIEVGGSSKLSFVGTAFQSGNGSDDGSGTNGPHYLLNYTDYSPDSYVSFVGGVGPGSTIGVVNNQVESTVRFVAVSGIADQ